MSENIDHLTWRNILESLCRYPKIILPSMCVYGGKELPYNDDLWQNAGMALSTPTLADEDTVSVTYTISLRVSVTDLKSLQRGRCPSPSCMIVSQDYGILIASFSLGRR
jgi:hypothetical protein